MAFNTPAHKFLFSEHTLNNTMLLALDGALTDITGSIKQSGMIGQCL